MEFKGRNFRAEIYSVRNFSLLGFSYTVYKIFISGVLCPCGINVVRGHLYTNTAN